ncbi:MAG: hypothetical protein ABIH01_01420 [Candidatus Omnitrophota bacterium]
MAESSLQVNKSRLGGLKRIELYGNPGTPEGRSKGGKKSTALFQLNPQLAKATGFIIRKEIKYPERSSELAEFIGIMLGDGCLPGNHQLTITFNNKTDCAYAEYIGNLLKKLFSIGYHIRKRKDSNGADIVVSSSNLVEFLLKQGLIAGNKVKHQVGIPYWVYGKSEYKIACLRGLMDTDGGLYLHKYHSNGSVYRYLKLCFGSRSKPLLNFVFGTLQKLSFKVYLNSAHVSIYSIPEVKRYFEEIGFHNSKHIEKFKKHFGH